MKINEFGFSNAREARFLTEYLRLKSGIYEPIHDVYIDKGNGMYLMETEVRRLVVALSAYADFFEQLDKSNRGGNE